MAQSVEDLVNKARTGSLATNDPDYQALVQHANAGVQSAKNALDRISQAGGASSKVSVNRFI